MPPMGDEDLMLLVREGNDDAFGLLVRRYRRPLLNFVYRMTGDPETAEDLSQEVFVRLWSNARTYTPTAKLSTFLYHIARNLYRDHLDKQRRCPTLTSLQLGMSDDEGSGRVLEDEIRDPGRGPYGELVRCQIEEEIAAALRTLPEDQRLIFVLTELQGLSYQAAAQIAGCPIGTVASRKSAAMKALRNRLSTDAGSRQ